MIPTPWIAFSSFSLASSLSSVQRNKDRTQAPKRKHSQTLSPPTPASRGPLSLQCSSGIPRFGRKRKLSGRRRRAKDLPGQPASCHHISGRARNRLAESKLEAGCRTGAKPKTLEVHERSGRRKCGLYPQAGKDLGQVICVALQAEETRTSLSLRGSGGAGSERHSVPPKTDAETLIKKKKVSSNLAIAKFIPRSNLGRDTPPFSHPNLGILVGGRVWELNPN